MPLPDPADGPPPAACPGRHLRFAFKLLGADFQWHSTPAPPGIELRDYLAAHALAGYMFHVSEDSGSALVAKVARTAYRMADEMLRARGADVEKKTPRSGTVNGDSDQRAGVD